jgi:hypothetical protein
MQFQFLAHQILNQTELPRFDLGNLSYKPFYFHHNPTLVNTGVHSRLPDKTLEAIEDPRTTTTTAFSSISFDAAAAGNTDLVMEANKAENAWVMAIIASFFPIAQKIAF